MGCTGSSGPKDEVVADRDINRQYQAQARAEEEEKKLLLLGTGASGKSTIFKNLRKSKGDVICDASTTEETANAVRSNLVQYMVKMLIKSQQIYEMDKEANKGCLIPDDSETLEYARIVLKYGQHNFADDALAANTDIEELGTAIDFLWKVPAIQETFKRRGLLYSFPDNLEFFYDKCSTVMNTKYAPTEEDVIKARVRTTGVINYTYSNDKGTFHITDVGGQRSERRKWIHQFEDVAAVIFLMALNHYNSVLFEDETKNAMHEAVELFVELANAKYFRNSELILLMNKKDLFIDALKTAPLGVCFTKAAGWDEPDQWSGPDYVPIPDDSAKDQETFTQCYEAAIQFVQNVFVNRNEVDSRIVFCHVITATDQKNVENVFWDVQNIVIRSNLRRGGLII